MSVKDLLTTPPLLTLNRETPVSVSFELLFASGFLSAPVLSKEGKVVGFLGLDDILIFAISVCKTAQDLAVYFALTDEKAASLVDLSGFSPITEEELAFMACEGVGLDSAGFITNFSKRNPLVTILPTSSIDELASVLAEFHRVCVVDDNNDLVGIVTQSDLVRYWHASGSFPATPISEIPQLGSTHITSILEGQKVLEAIRNMGATRAGACAVLNDKGELVSNFSTLDIRGISTSGDMMDRLYWTTGDFLDALEKQEKIHPRGTPTTNKTALLSDVVGQLTEKRRHHIYIVGDDKKPAKVISLGDLIRWKIGK